MKRLISCLLIAAMCAPIIGCSKGDGDKTVKVNLEPKDFTQYKDSEEIPDWEGEKLELIKWGQASNTASKVSKTNIVTDDPVTKELERITGVTYSVDESFDNNGNSYDAVVAKLIAANDFPHMAEGIPDATQLIRGEYLWNLEPYLKTYAPTLYKLFGPDSKTMYGDFWKYQKENFDGIYELPLGYMTRGLEDMRDKDGTVDMTDEQLRAILNKDISYYPYFYMRDDILKQLYPQAHTVAELKAIYEERGEFTKEEILDVPIKSSQDFLDLLYKIKDLNLKDGDAEVYPMFTHVGADNWPVLVQLGGMFGYATSVPGENPNYFSYYDMNDDTVKATFKQPWFKDILKMYNKLVRDEVASPEALIDTNNLYKEKLNNGRYIVCYGSYSPSEAALGGRYAYRKVYCDFPSVDESKFLYNDYDYTKNHKLTFFKDSLSEEQLVQVLQMLEFCASDAGQKLMYWGPKSAGYYTENADGTIDYVDEEVKNQMIKPGQYGSDKLIKMGLGYGTTASWPGKVYFVHSKYNPRAVYADELETWSSAYDGARIKKQTLTPSAAPNIYDAQALAEIPEAQRFWNSRNGFEDALLKVFAASNDAEFEELYNKMVKYAEDNGLTDETYKQYTELYKTKLNASYMHYIEEKKAELNK